jgi:hypothetical protein
MIPPAQFRSFADELEKISVIRGIANLFGARRAGEAVNSAIEGPIRRGGRKLVQAAGLNLPVLDSVGQPLAGQTSPYTVGLHKAIDMVAEHPETLPMQAVPVPGLTPAYLAGKNILNRALGEKS